MLQKTAFCIKMGVTCLQQVRAFLAVDLPQTLGWFKQDVLNSWKMGPVEPWSLLAPVVHGLRGVSGRLNSCSVFRVDGTPTPPTCRLDGGP